MKIRIEFLSMSLIFTVGFLVSACKQESEIPQVPVPIFPQGQKGSEENFTGNAYNYGLVSNDSLLTTLVGNVYFEAGARSNWHSHPAGQILIITDGEGFHQIKDQPKQALKKGDVVTCPPNVLHWHGASPQVGMQQLYIVPNTEKGIVDWQHTVSDEEYFAVN